MNLYSSNQVYELDRLAITIDKQSSLQLMQKAAESVWQQLQIRWADKQEIVIFAGTGNNGGDAFALARLALVAGYKVRLFYFGDLSRQSTESVHYRNLWEQQGGVSELWKDQAYQAEIIIDGLLGIGLNQPLNEQWQQLVKNINHHPAIRVSIDIPSGLNANTGTAMPIAVEANLTVSFIGRKQGCYLADGPDYCGERIFADLGLSTRAGTKVKASLEVLDNKNLQLPPNRKKNSYKNQYGHVLVIGAGPGMSGAARLAGMSALRCGAGLVSLCVHPDNYTIAASTHAELMVSTWSELSEQLAKASVILVGPGLGHSKAAKALLQQLKSVALPMVIDADALYPDYVDSVQSSRVVLTPHPGEMARLLSMHTNLVQSDRVNALLASNERWNHVCILKGCGTLIGQRKQTTALCQQGHPGMATAGSGDVLAGITAGFLAQGLDAYSASRTAVFVHARAADQYALKQAADCMIAGDIIDQLPVVMKSLREDQDKHR